MIGVSTPRVAPNEGSVRFISEVAAVRQLDTIGVKKDLLLRLREARKAHRRWVSHALALIEGAEISPDQIPVNETECGFGKWYYGKGQSLSQLEQFQQIEKPHERLHRIYMEIFNLLFDTKKPSFWKRLLGRSHSRSPETLEAARRRYSELNDLSHEISDRLKMLEKRIIDMDEEELRNIF